MHSKPGRHLFLAQYCCCCCWTDLLPTTEQASSEPFESSEEETFEWWFSKEEEEESRSLWKERRNRSLSGSILVVVRISERTRFDLATFCFTFRILCTASSWRFPTQLRSFVLWFSIGFWLPAFHSHQNWVSYKLGEKRMFKFVLRQKNHCSYDHSLWIRQKLKKEHQKPVI